MHSQKHIAGGYDEKTTGEKHKKRLKLHKVTSTEKRMKKSKE